MALFRRANGYFMEGKNFAKIFVVKAEFYLFHVWLLHMYFSNRYVNKKDIMHFLNSQWIQFISGVNKSDLILKEN